MITEKFLRAEIHLLEGQRNSWLEGFLDLLYHLDQRQILLLLKENSAICRPFLLYRKINCFKLVWNSIVNVSLLRIYCNLYLFLTDYPDIWKELHFIFSGGHLFMLILSLQSDLGCSNYGIWRAKQIYSCWNRGKGKITSGCSKNSREWTGL